MHKRALIFCKETSEQKSNEHRPIFVEDPDMNDDISVQKRFLQSFEKVTRSYAKGRTRQASRETYMQIWVVFKKLAARDSVRGNTRQSAKITQRLNRQLMEDGMGSDREVERINYAISYSRHKKVKLAAAESAAGRISLDDIPPPSGDSVAQSEFHDRIMKRLREEKNKRDVQYSDRERSFREYCHPITLAKKVRLENGEDGTELIQCHMMPMQMFAAIGLPFMMYRGMIPRRPNFVEEVEGASGVAAVGTVVDDPTNMLNLPLDRAKEELNRLAWDTCTRPYAQLNEALIGVIRGQRRAPQSDEEMEAPGVTAARTAAPSAGDVVDDVDHTDENNLGSGH